MYKEGSLRGTVRVAMVLGAAMVLCAGVQAQEQQTPQGQGNASVKRPSVPDAQIEANVLKALASSPEVADQNIQSDTVYGVVTLSGSVTTDAARQKADDLVSRVAGVQKVIDQMTIGEASAETEAPGQPDAQGAPQQQPENYPSAQNPPYPQTGYPGAPEYPQNAPNAGNGQPSYPPQQGQSYPPQNYPPQSYPPQGQGYPQQGQNYPPQSYPPQNYPPQGQYPQQQSYPPQGGNGEFYGAQRAGDTVTIAPGSLLRVRINEGLSSQRNQAGATFDGIVMNDVIAEGAVAIPRGATVQGEVVTASASGAVSGHGELTLALTGVVLGGRTFPLTTDTWSRASGDKTQHTVNTALGLGVLGAIIGGVAGGGGGAAVGAAAGAGVGVAASAGSPRGQVLIPPEAILTFHTTAPTPVTTVSQAEMDRLGYGVPNGQSQPVMRRRMAPPPPPYYGRPYPY